MVIDQFKMVAPGIFSFGDTGNGASYDTKARVYEFLVSTNLYNKIAWGTLPADYIAFAKLAIEKSSGSVIDIGCGGLTHTAKLYSKFRNELVLIDNSFEMLSIAQKRLQKISGELNTRTRFLLADAFDLPFEESFDSLFSFGMLHLFDDKRAYLETIFRTLKKGGRFFISSLTTDRKLSKTYIKVLQRNNEMGEGFSSQEIQALTREYAGELNSYIIGSMIFMNGIK